MAGCPDGLDLLQRLAERFDIIITADEFDIPNPLDTIELPPASIHCTIRPFSSAGPKSRYRGTDLVVMAASGPPAVTGEDDRAPLLFPLPQSIMEAGAEAYAFTFG